MNSQNKFIAKGISLIFFWLIVIATLATLFSCEPDPLCSFEYTQGGVTYTEYYDCNEPITIN